MIIPLAIYLVFCGLVTLANALFLRHRRTGRDRDEAIGGILFLLALVGPGAIALELGRRGTIALPMWPAAPFPALGLLVVFLLLARNEMLARIVAEGREPGPALATFLGPLGIHFTSMLVSVGILFPALKALVPLPLAVVLAAAAFALYHCCQFAVFPRGLMPALQFQLFGFSLGYVLLYHLTGAFFPVFVLQHLVATTTFIHNRDHDFGQRDLPFYFGLAVAAAAIAFTAAFLH